MTPSGTPHRAATTTAPDGRAAVTMRDAMMSTGRGVWWVMVLVIILVIVGIAVWHRRALVRVRTKAALAVVS